MVDHESETLPVAIGPRGTRSYLAEAVVAGGGRIVDAEEAVALVWTDPHEPAGLAAVLGEYRNIEWVQLPWAGVEPMREVLDQKHVWTCGKGVYAEEVAEHGLMLSLAGYRQMKRFATATSWGTPAGESLFGRRVTILGGGGIAASFVRLLAPFGCDITVLRRSDTPFEGADRTLTLDDLPRVAPTTDLLFLALALTPETTGVVDAEILALLPPLCWIVNVARGEHIVTDALVDALVGQTIGGAALDVTHPEPLPDDHPLWSLPNCLITPHTANTPEMAKPVLARRVTENIARYLRNEELLGRVDPLAGF